MSNNSVDLGFALNLPNDRAIDYLSNKQVVSASHFKELGESAHAKAFTVANINHLGLLSDMKKSMDESMRQGEPFEAWRDRLEIRAQKRGWLSNGEFFNPDGGEVIKPYRLKTIFNTNTSSAFHASRYQSQMDNAIDFPYLELVAVGDAATRPSHLALSGTVKRIDDPFWQSYYPPLGYNCRCIVISRSDYYIKKRGIEIDEVTKVEHDDDGDPYVERDGIEVRPDKGFEYNSARHGYRPDLDDYDPVLANQFCERDMASPEFNLQYQRLEREYKRERKKARLDSKQKFRDDVLVSIRRKARHNLYFSAGVITHSLPIPKRTVWLSDDTIVKQFNSRLGDLKINAAFYTQLPGIVSQPDYILEGRNRYYFIKQTASGWIRSVVKVSSNDEIFLESSHYIDEKTLKSDLKKYTVIKKP